MNAEKLMNIILKDKSQGYYIFYVFFVSPRIDEPLLTNVAY